MTRVAFTERGWEEYTYWVTQESVLAKVNRMIDEATRDPARGIGKPELRRESLAGAWAPRITEVDRLVYTVTDGVLTVLQCRYHY